MEMRDEGRSSPWRPWSVAQGGSEAGEELICRVEELEAAAAQLLEEKEAPEDMARRGRS